MKEYWIVNLNGFSVEVHRRPRNGAYQSVESFGIGESVSPQQFPAVALLVSDLFNK